MKKVSDIFKSIRFAKNVPGHDKGPATSTDDEEHGAVSSQEFEQQLAHVKKRSMQEGNGYDDNRRGFGKPPREDDEYHVPDPTAKKVKKEEVESLEEGRPSQRHPLEGHDYHKKTDAELEYIAKDAHKAAEAMKSHNTDAENKYRDQANDSATVRYFRKKNGMPNWYKKKYGHVNEETVNEVKDEGEYGYEGDMAMNQLETVIRHATYLKDMMKPDTDLPEWVQSKITLATDYLQTACDYMTSEMKEEVEQIDELSNDTLGRYKTAAGADASKADKAGDYAKGNKRFSGIVKATKKQFANDMKKEDTTPPFDGPYTKAQGTITDKSGAKHTVQSRVRDLARKAMQTQADKLKSTKTVKESLEESRKAEIIKDAVKSAKEKTAKTKDKFEADPVLSSEIVKEDK